MRRFSGGLVSKRTRGAVGPGAGARRGRPCWPSRPRRRARRSRRSVAARERRRRGRGAGGSWIPRSSRVGGSRRASTPARARRCPCHPTAIRSGRATLRAVCRRFPRDGTAFLVLSTGDATQADQPTGRVRSPTSTTVAACRSRARDRRAHDLTVLQIPFNSPSSPRAAASGLRLLRLPLPLGGVPVAARPAPSTTPSSPRSTTRPGRRRAPPSRRPTTSPRSPSGQPVTIKSTGLAAMSPAEAAGTPYGAATGLLHAQVLVPARGHDAIRSSSRSSTTATARWTAPSSSTTSRSRRSPERLLRRA